MHGVIAAWGRILTGYRPSLSIEITRECPLTCPGCYAYTPDHLGGGVALRQLTDYKGQELVDRTLALVRFHRPLHVSIVGGEPLVRYRELDRILPEISRMGIYTQVVTSAVRPIPEAWTSIPRLKIVVSIDGLPPEHDERRKPATYERILKHIEGRRITVHCTVTSQQVRREGYLEEFIRFWSSRSEVTQIWVSLYTPQIGEVSIERLTPADRIRVVDELKMLRAVYPKLDMPNGLIQVYADPPQTPDECVFARTTHCVSADLQHQITPCQYGGNPDCSNCGCVASAALAAVARHRLPGGLRVGLIYEASHTVGRQVRRLRRGRPARPRGQVVGAQPASGTPPLL
jgi:MoaA/NifB/PqqE/SkfB family radical SAM enzyme